MEKNSDANESINFGPINFFESEENKTEVEYCFGSFETKSLDGKNSNKVHIEKIEGCETYANEDSVDGVLVIWCAKSFNNDTKVVGWYKNATVYREYQAVDIDVAEDETVTHIDNISALAKDCVLIPEGARNRHVWNAPRARKWTYGFGQANVWYPKEEAAKPYLEKIVKQIDEYEGDNWIDQYPE